MRCEEICEKKKKKERKNAPSYIKFESSSSDWQSKKNIEEMLKEYIERVMKIGVTHMWRRETFQALVGRLGQQEVET